MSRLPSELRPLSDYHPIFIEGKGSKDPRDPEKVARRIHEQLLRHWATSECTKPKIIITQGDPLAERGISAITSRVADLLGVFRCLVVFDDHHGKTADRTNNVILEYQYSQMASVLDPGCLTEVETRIDSLLQEKNQKLVFGGKPPLQDYCRNFALLQEVSKAACHLICGDVTVGHTDEIVDEFSVTSFFEAGLDLGLIQKEQMILYKEEEDCDR